VTAVLRLLVEIALMRRGPEDLPASPVILALTAAGYFLVNFAVSTLAPPIPGPWLQQLALDVAFIFLWNRIVLDLRRKPERYLQTTTALFGYQAVIAPLWIGAVWAVGRFRNDPPVLFPVSVAGLAILVWMLAVNVRILRSALEWPTGACVGIVVLQTIVSQLLLISLFPAVPASAGH
jgi:hypothetical protein